ncbi:MAG: hypothetical protein JSV33_11220 [bacterium]|nr:MAG: hypothetical protein JSV33_11220 [bacterium]
MSRFKELLQRMNERLDLPQPEKSRILLEIAADLEDMYELYRGQGIGEEEAVRKAMEKFDVSDEALDELVQIHESSFRRLLSRFSEQARTRWERVLLSVVILFIAAFAGRELLSTEIFKQASGFIWPVASAAFGTLVITVFQVYRLYIKKDHAIRRLRSGLVYLPVMGCLSMLVGMYGFFMELYRLVVSGMPEIESSMMHLVQWGIHASATLVVSLLMAIVAGLLWFLFSNKVRSIEIAEAAWLLDQDFIES